MTNLEHFIENGLSLLESGIDPDEWAKEMKIDPNKPYVSIGVDTLWEICQYIYFSYIPCAVDQHRFCLLQQTESDDACCRWLHQGDDYFCGKCGFSSEDIMYINPLWKYTHYRFCPNCGTKMGEVEEVNG